MKSKRYPTIFQLAVLLGIAGLSTSLFWRHQPTAQEIIAALDNTVIPQLSFHNVPYSAAAVVLDHARRAHPELQRVRFISLVSIGPPKFSDFESVVHSANVTLELKDIPAHEALNYVAAVSNLRYTVRDGCVYFHEVTANGRPPPLTVRERLVSYANDTYLHFHDVLISMTATPNPEGCMPRSRHATLER